MKNINIKDKKVDSHNLAGQGKTPSSKRDFLVKLHDNSAKNIIGFKDFLSERALVDPDSLVRYLALQVLYHDYFRDSKSLIRWCLMKDDNYDIPIMNLSTPLRHSFNDLINVAVDKKLKRDRLVSDVIRYDFLFFMLHHKELIEDFNAKMFFSSNLHCFILNFIDEKSLLYYFKEEIDPFFHTKQQSTLKYDEPLKLFKFNRPMKFIERYVLKFSNQIQLIKWMLPFEPDLPILRVKLKNHPDIFYLDKHQSHYL
jgi:hypothetical protein